MTRASLQLVGSIFMVSFALGVTPTAPRSRIIEYIDGNLPVTGSSEETNSPTDRSRARVLLLTRHVCLDAARPEAELVRWQFALTLHTQENSRARDKESSPPLEKAKWGETPTRNLNRKSAFRNPEQTFASGLPAVNFLCVVGERRNSGHPKNASCHSR